MCTSTVDKIKNSKLRWFSYVMRKEKSKTVWKVMEINIEEKRE